MTFKRTQFKRKPIGTAAQRKKPNATARADVEFSRQIRGAANGKCWAEGKTDFACNGYMQCCHVVSRRYRAIRWYAGNAVAMCAAHHRYYTSAVLEWQEVVGESTWQTLRRMALHGPAEKAVDAIERLKAMG